ncbi:DUF7146 domain-containing protein [Piscirickettsia litoralis]|nr:toprim domain-containing protein [Piscirickettsia litoralis]
MNYINAKQVREKAQNQWLCVLSGLAPQLESALKKPGRHVSCPVHHGQDGFRLFKDVNETGGGICNSCGAKSDGFELLKWLNGWSFRETLEQVAAFLGVTSLHNQVDSHKQQPWLQHAQQQLTQQKKQSEQAAFWITQVWNQAQPLGDDAVKRYLQQRRCFTSHVSDCVRFHPALPYFDEEGHRVGEFPAMVCSVQNAAGQIVTLHRTYLTNEGHKAPVEKVKKMMSIPDNLAVAGNAIRLVGPQGSILGIAEGIETALSVYLATGIPTWSAMTATLLKSVQPPKSIRTVIIWADQDRSCAGEEAALILKERLQQQGITVLVMLPDQCLLGDRKSVDWNDVWCQHQHAGFPTKKSLQQHYFQEKQRMAQINMSVIDTEAGKSGECAFCPPHGWQGNPDDYLMLMRERYRDVMFYQRMLVTAKLQKKVKLVIRGPFAQEVQCILGKLNQTIAA